MKKITFLALLSVLTLTSIAQNKFGHIDSQELLLLMPERKTAETEVQEFAKSLESQLGAMTATAKAREYMAPFPPSSPSIAVFKDGKLVHCIERHHIEGRSAEMIADNLKDCFDQIC